MRKPTLLFAGLAAGALALAGCTATDDAETTTGSAATTVTTEEAVTVTASGDVLTEVTYAELGIKDMDLAVDRSGAVAIALSDSGSTGGDGVVVDGSTVTITAGGTYVLAGSLSDGRVVVATDGADVNLILDGVDITADGIAALDIEDADEVVVWLADGSTNTLASAADAAATAEDATDVPNATLYSTADLWIAGAGSLTVDGSPEDGITSKDGLVLAGGTIDVTAADDGVRGKDNLVIDGATVTVDVGGDGLRSDNEDVADDSGSAVGVVWIADGAVDVTAGADGIEAYRQVAVEGGALAISAGDDGVHTEGVLHVSDGSIDIATSYEGLEGGVILLSGGSGSIVSSDDGVNVSSGTGAGGGMGDPGMGGPRQGPGAAGGTASAATAATVATTVAASTGDSSDVTTESVAMGGMDQAEEGLYLQISGGSWTIDADGDGLDSNGSATISGGIVVVDGPTSNGNGALDVNGSFTIAGGTLAAAGSSGMLEAPEGTDAQGVLTVVFSSAVAQGSTITISDADGAPVASFTAAKTAQSLVLSTADIVPGDDYTVTVGAAVSGDGVGGLVLDGTASGGDALGTVTAA